MSIKVNMEKLKPVGKHILIKDPAEKEEYYDSKKRIAIPDSFRTSEDRHTRIFTGLIIACGEKTKFKKFGPDFACYKPGDKIMFRGLYNWNDDQMVFLDDDGGRYMFINEDDLELVLA